MIRTPVDAISEQGRNTQGVRLMRVAEDCRIVCVARAEAEPDEPDEPQPIRPKTAARTATTTHKRLRYSLTKPHA